VVAEVGKKDFMRFNANPQPRSFAYATVEFKQGKYSVVFHPNFTDRKVLLSFGTKTKADEINPNYPLLPGTGRAHASPWFITRKEKPGCLYTTR
jgi:hypothetical protein